MTYLEAVLQGILQGLTEFLPVSSSGHLSLFQHFTGSSGDTGIFFSPSGHVDCSIYCFPAHHLAAVSGIFLDDLGHFAGKIQLEKPERVSEYADHADAVLRTADFCGCAQGLL